MFLIKIDWNANIAGEMFYHFFTRERFCQTTAKSKVKKTIGGNLFIFTIELKYLYYTFFQVNTDKS